MLTLLRLLHARLGASNVAVDISCVRSLPNHTLDGLPDLSNDWRDVLVGDRGVDLGGSLVNCALDESALAISSPEEDSVNNYQYPAAFGESDSRKKNAEPK